MCFCALGAPEKNPDIMEIELPEKFQFAEVNISSFIHGKLHHHRPGLRAREDLKALMHFCMVKDVRDALRLDECL